MSNKMKTDSTPSNAVFSAILGFVPGAVGGFCNVVVGHPIDLVKVRQQTASMSSSMTTTATTRAVTTASLISKNSGAATSGAQQRQRRRAAAGAFRSSSSSTTASRVVTTAATARTARARLNAAIAATAAAAPGPAPTAGTLGTLRAIVLREGFAGLYAGVSAPIVAVVPAFAISFGSFDLAKTVQLRYSGNAELSVAQTAVAGGFSGLPLALVLGPLERIKCLLQVNKAQYGGFFQCVRAVYSDGGIRSIFRGTGLTIARDVPGNAAFFAGYEITKSVLCRLEGTDRDGLKPSMATTLVAGGMAGVCNWIVAIPMDVVKSTWQTSPTGTYSSASHVIRSLLAKEGPAAFAKGLGPALLRAFPSCSACFLGVETARSLLPTAAALK